MSGIRIFGIRIVPLYLTLFWLFQVDLSRVNEFGYSGDMLDDPTKAVEAVDGLVPVAAEPQAAITNGEVKKANKSASKGDIASNGDKPKTKANKKKDWSSYPTCLNI